MPENSKSRSHHKPNRLLIGVLALILLCGCAKAVSREELLRQIQGTTAPLIVDVRSRSEYDRDHLPGAVHIPFYSIGSGLREIKFLKGEPLVLYCEHGPRAGVAALFLSVSGYEKIYSLEGHMKGWRQNQFPVESIRH